MIILQHLDNWWQLSRRFEQSPYLMLHGRPIRTHLSIVTSVTIEPTYMKPRQHKKCPICQWCWLVNVNDNRTADGIVYGPTCKHTRWHLPGPFDSFSVPKKDYSRRRVVNNKNIRCRFWILCVTYLSVVEKAIRWLYYGVNEYTILGDKKSGTVNIFIFNDGTKMTVGLMETNRR